METTNNYDYSIFKPVNEFSRRNRNIILSIILIWAVCVFGFQFLLLVLQKPTPEPALIEYNAVAPRVFDGTASVIDRQAYAGSLLMVLGKTVAPSDRQVLGYELTRVVYGLLADSADQAILINKLLPLYEKRTELAEVKAGWDAKRVTYTDYKQSSLSLNQQIVGLKDDLGVFLTRVADRIIPADDAFRHVKMVWLPYELRAPAILDPRPVDTHDLDRIMNLYLTHNQSFLTDFPVLGFPFHYFYTAVFLLVLFVLLCVLYAYRIQHLHRKFEMEE